MHVHAMYMHALWAQQFNVREHFGALVFGAAMSFDEGYLNETPRPRDFQRALEDVIRLAPYANAPRPTTSRSSSGKHSHVPYSQVAS